MIKVKHFLEAAEASDGQRIWAEPVGLTKDLREWCRVDHVLPHLGPPRELWNWFDEHPDGYGHFRGQYHEALNKSPYRTALQQLATAARRETFTLLHQGEKNDENSGQAMLELLSELEAWCPPDDAT